MSDARQRYFESWLKGKIGASDAWLRPLHFVPPPVVVKPKRSYVTKKPRVITIRGITYPSITECRKLTGWSIDRIYRLLGEGRKQAG